MKRLKYERLKVPLANWKVEKGSQLSKQFELYLLLTAKFSGASLKFLQVASLHFENTILHFKYLYYTNMKEDIPNGIIG